MADNLMLVLLGAALAAIQLTSGGDTILVQPFGSNALRVRVRMGGKPINEDLPGALVEPKGAELGVERFVDANSAAVSFENSVTNGNIAATVDVSGLITVTRVSDGKIILKEVSRTFETSNAPNTPTATVSFSSNRSELIYGFGEHQQGHLDMKGTSFDMEKCLDYGHSHGGEVCLPFILAGTSSHQNSDCHASPSIGCYHDARDRILPYDAVSGINDPTMTIEKCAAECGALGYKYMGVESSTQCYCGHTAPDATKKIDDSQCNKPCAGDQTETCGAGWIMNLHTVNCTATPVNNTAHSQIQYGLLWNMPNYGSVNFMETSTNWTAYAAEQIDYFVTTYGENSEGTNQAADIMHAYVDAVGKKAHEQYKTITARVRRLRAQHARALQQRHSPMLPEYAAGYWHSKNRYASQADLLKAAEGFHNRSVPVDIIVIDYHHWVTMGDWSFDAKAWPDIPGMMAQLDSFGMKVMVSVWPFTATGSQSFADVSQKSLAVKVGGNHSEAVWWDDNNCNAKCYLLDQSQADTRAYFWSSRLMAGYYKHGIKIYWLDASEPEISTADARKAAMDSHYSQGSTQSAGMMFPYWHTRAIHDGLLSAGEKDGEIIQLTRSAWAGMQKWGAALWSGDTRSSFASLKVSIQAGLNTQLSGIAWWTTDIGGYSGGKPSDATFRELIVRWFQYGATCPLFRQHGARATEIWGYGPESEAAIVKVIEWRKAQKPYVMRAMQQVSATGKPVNRPLWFDFPADAKTWGITDSYMFGDDYLVSPVTDMGARNWTLYLPTDATAGAKYVWEHVFSKQRFDGGNTVTIDTPLDEFPLFKKVA